PANRENLAAVQRFSVRLRSAEKILQGGRMMSRAVMALFVLFPLSFLTADPAAVPANAAGEYSKHLGALGKLSIAVAQAMPPDQYGFRPHPESMTFGELISHIATTNYQFCAG